MKTVTQLPRALPFAKAREALDILEQAYAYYTPAPWVARPEDLADTAYDFAA